MNFIGPFEGGVHVSKRSMRTLVGVAMFVATFAIVSPRLGFA